MNKALQREQTKARVERYRDRQKALQKGSVTDASVTPIIRFDNGTYLHINKLVDSKWRGLISYLVENLKPAYQESIRVGMRGPSIRECKKLLEVTA